MDEWIKNKVQKGNLGRKELGPSLKCGDGLEEKERERQAEYE